MSLLLLRSLKVAAGLDSEREPWEELPNHLFDFLPAQVDTLGSEASVNGPSLKKYLEAEPRLD